MTTYLKFKLSIKAALAVLIVGSIFAGCYHISRGGSSKASKSLTSVAVPLFKNECEVMGIEVPATEAFIAKLDYYGATKVEKIENARSIIEGKVIDYKLSTAAIDQRHKITEYRLTLTLNIMVRDTKTNEVVFKKEEYSDSYDFKVPRDSIIRKREVKRAEEFLCNKIASAIITELYEGF
ncbi:MAG: hypothetical protein D6734_06750 [Candidatus Schekmanbacteria bacterium]|nr:MAG: hypothetical protein D6734_06750 [Candidatus Schekmanbacteria bacterium]